MELSDFKPRLAAWPSGTGRRGAPLGQKPAEQTTLHRLWLLAELLVEAGLPAGVCNVVTGTGRRPCARWLPTPELTISPSQGSVTNV